MPESANKKPVEDKPKVEDGKNKNAPPNSASTSNLKSADTTTPTPAPKKGIKDLWLRLIQRKKDKRRLLVGTEAKQTYSRRLHNALMPVRVLSSLFGQFPLTYKLEKNGTYTFQFSWYNPSAIYFGFMVFISYYCLIFGGWNLYVTIVNVHEVSDPSADSLEERWFEKSLFHRHLMWVCSFIAAVIQTCCSLLYLLKNRHYMPTVLTFYSRVVQNLHMDISAGVLISTLFLIVIFAFTTIFILVLGLLRFAPVTIGTPTLFGVYMFRLFLTHEGIWIDHSSAVRRTVQVLGAIFLFIIFCSSKIQMFMFIFHCKLLKNSFACWNGRAYIALMKGGKYFLTHEGKLTFQLLYKDHCVILDMLEASNRLCAGIMEMYYGTQTATIFFELYFALRTARYGENKELASEQGGKFFIRPFDWLPGLLLAVQTLIIALYTSNVAASVGHEAMAGLDIVRRKTMLNRKTDDELLFQLSMQNSFNSFQGFDISGGGYQYINVDWIMSYLNNIAGYFIILYQFQPVMDRSTPKGEEERRKHLGQLLTNLEGLPEGHYVAKPPDTAIVYP